MFTWQEEERPAVQAVTDGSELMLGLPVLHDSRPSSGS
jgi:hypothetical protein